MDESGFFSLIAAIVTRARLDAHHPSGSRMGDGQRAELQQDATDFLRWVDAQREELTDLAACAMLPQPQLCRHTHGGSIRWEINENERGRQRRQKVNEYAN